MKKLFTILALSLICVFCAIGFAACGEKGDTGATGAQGIQGEKGDTGATGEKGKDGKDGVSIVNIEKTSTDGLVDTYTITYSDGNTFEFTITNGQNGEKGDTGAQGIQGEKGDTGAQGIQGEKGDTGAQGIQGEKGDTGENGLSAYEIFLKYYPNYPGTEEQWIIGLINGDLTTCAVTFKSEVAEDIVKYVFKGYALTDIPEVPEKEGQTNAVWDITDFSNITDNLTVNAVYDMRKYITFRNEYTDDEDIIKVVNYGEELTEIPEITQKTGNTAKWSVTDFSEIKNDLLVQAVYETQGLEYTLINQETEYSVAKGEMTATELFIPAEYNGKPVTSIGYYAFEYCSGLKSVTIGNSVTSIGSHAFCDCSSLTSVTIGNGVTSIGQFAFNNCTSLSEITIPDSVTSIGNAAFYSCINLTSVIIPDSVTSIGESVFAGCSNLETINIGNSVTSIEYGAFKNCSRLTSMVIPDSVTYIYNAAFYGCSSLKSITITKRVTYIGYEVFFYCSSLESVTFNGTQAEWRAISKGHYWYNAVPSKCIIHCTDGDIHIADA